MNDALQKVSHDIYDMIYVDMSSTLYITLMKCL